MKKRVRVDMPIEAYNSLKKKKEVLEKILQEHYKQPQKITFADTLRFFSQKKTFVYNDEVIRFVKKKRIERGERLI